MYNVISAKAQESARHVTERDGSTAFTEIPSSVLTAILPIEANAADAVAKEPSMV